MGALLSQERPVPRVIAKVGWDLWQTIAGYGSQQDVGRLLVCCSVIHAQHGQKPLHSARLSLADLVARRKTALCAQLLCEHLPLGKWVYLEEIDLGTLPFERIYLKRISMAINAAPLRGLVWVNSDVPAFADAIDVAAKRVEGSADRVGWLQLNQFQMGPVFKVSWFIPGFATYGELHGECLTSPSFDFGGYTWSCGAYPTGNTRYTSEYVSVYIQNESLRCFENRSFRAKFGIIVVHPSCSELNIVRQAAQVFNFGSYMAPGPYDRGWHKMIACDDLFELQYLRDLDGALQLNFELRPLLS